MKIKIYRKNNRKNEKIKNISIKDKENNEMKK